MQTVGNITGYVDIAQLLLYAFWIFFAGLIYYLVRENHREGYPMESSTNGRVVVSGFPIPEPKTFLLEGGRSVTVPDLSRQEPAYKAAPLTPSSGEPWCRQVMPCCLRRVRVLTQIARMCRR